MTYPSTPDTHEGTFDLCVSRGHALNKRGTHVRLAGEAIDAILYRPGHGTTAPVHIRWGSGETNGTVLSKLTPFLIQHGVVDARGWTHYEVVNWKAVNEALLRVSSANQLTAGSPIERAIAYVSESVLEPALADMRLSQELRDKVKNSRYWIGRFERVGDLLRYLERFDASKGSATYAALREHGLLGFEDIVLPMRERFATWAADCTTPNTFVVGRQYDSYQILIFVAAYDLRAGGMFLLGSRTQPEAVVIKATLSGGAYANEWLEEGRRLKYYLKARGDVFGEHFQENAAILKTPGLPVLTFVRRSEDEAFTYAGPFAYQSITREADGSKWFELTRDSSMQAVHSVVDRQYEELQLVAQVEAAKRLSHEERKARLLLEPRLPRKMVVQTTAFARSALVIAEVLERAQGVCEGCSRPAPFRRKADGSPYLEVHHRVRLADGGEDTVENAVAMCPNCHRASHFG